MGRTTRRVFCLGLGFLAGCLLPGPGPVAATVFWTSASNAPGDVALLYGDGLEGVSMVQVVRLADGEPGSPKAHTLPSAPPNASVQTAPIQPAASSVKFRVPPTLVPGMYTAWLKTGAGWSPPVLLNRAAPWWVQSDQGPDAASPGGWVRVLGTDLAAGATAPRVMLVPEGGGAALTLALEQATSFNLTARVPEDAPPGRYRVWVHSGLGGAQGWSAAESLKVTPRAPAPEGLYDVVRHGATADGQKDDTAAVTAAIQAAAQAGSGVVYFPRGAYRLAGMLEVPPGVVLRGERQDLVSLVWPDSGPRLPAVIRGTHGFGVEHLTLVFVLADHGVVADTQAPDAGDVFLDHVRMRWLLYSGHLKPEETLERFQTALKQSSGGGDLVRLGGRHVRVTHCDLYSAGRVLFLDDARGAVVADNLLRNGRWGWYDLNGGEKIVFERNRVMGGDLMSTGGSVSTFGRPSSRFIYMADNTFENLQGWDREAITSDAGGGPHVGKVAGAAPQSVAYPEGVALSPNGLVGQAAYVLEGRGKGQYRRIVANTQRTLEVEPAWDVVPDTSSVVGVTGMKGRYLFVNNTVVDAGIAVQFYGAAFDAVVAGNRSVRAGGFRSYAARYLGNYDVPITQGVQPQLFVQYLDNEIAEGNGYAAGGFQPSALMVDVSAPGPAWNWPMALGFVIRGNRLDSSASIRVLTSENGAPLAEDFVIERNTVKLSPVGIEIGPRVARMVLRDNRFQDVTQPVLDPAGLAQVLPAP